MRLPAVVVGLGKLVDAIKRFLYLYQLVSFLVETLCVLIALILHDRQTHVHLVAGLAALMFGVIMAASDLLNVLVDLENLTRRCLPRWRRPQAAVGLARPGVRILVDLWRLRLGVLTLDKTPSRLLWLLLMMALL